MEHYPGLKGNEILTHAATWMHHEENDWFLQIATTAKKKKKKCKKAKWLSEQALQRAEEREVKGKGER